MGVIAAAARVALLLERVEPLFGEPRNSRLADLQVMRLDDGFVDLLGQQLEADVLAERRVPALTKQPLPAMVSMTP